MTIHEQENILWEEWAGTYPAQESIYPDLTFFPINSWCHYCKDPELLLINSWHPSSRILDSQKIDGMMQAVAGFMVQTHADIFH